MKKTLSGVKGFATLSTDNQAWFRNDDARKVCEDVAYDCGLDSADNYSVVELAEVCGVVVAVMNGGLAHTLNAPGIFQDTFESLAVCKEMLPEIIENVSRNR